MEIRLERTHMSITPLCVLYINKSAHPFCKYQIPSTKGICKFVHLGRTKWLCENLDRVCDCLKSSHNEQIEKIDETDESKRALTPQDMALMIFEREHRTKQELARIQKEYTKISVMYANLFTDIRNIVNAYSTRSSKNKSINYKKCHNDILDIVNKAEEFHKKEWEK